MVDLETRARVPHADLETDEHYRLVERGLPRDPEWNVAGQYERLDVSDVELSQLPFALTLPTVGEGWDADSLSASLTGTKSDGYIDDCESGSES